jgi:tRNA A-37 threonylcarbamoyl transferase component Bud32
MSYIHLGRSGCKLEIKDGSIVRKSSTQSAYNSRLIVQAKKQSVFPQSKYKNLLAPKVYNIENSSDCYFDMEYIPGSSFVDFFETSSLQTIENVTNTIINFLKLNLSNSMDKSINEPLLEKLELLSLSSQFKETILKLKATIIRDKLMIPNSYCHGDMTISNMLYTDSKIYLIDFLDSFIDSVVVDLVKLKQDLYYLWSLEMVGIRKTRFISIFSYMWGRIETEFNSQVDSKVFKVLEVMNFLRIEPYISEIREFELLSNIIKRLGEYE